MISDFQPLSNLKVPTIDDVPVHHGKEIEITKKDVNRKRRTDKVNGVFESKFFFITKANF